MNIKTIKETRLKLTVQLFTRDHLLKVAEGSIIIDQKSVGKAAGMIENVWVDDKRRKSGLGSAVVQELIKLAKENNCYKVTLSCANHNIPFYTKNGFHIHQNAMRIDL